MNEGLPVGVYNEYDIYELLEFLYYHKIMMIIYITDSVSDLVNPICLFKEDQFVYKNE
mgnify:FL=1